MIIYKDGNILSSNTNIIVQQVNCQGVMGSGLAKEIRTNFPGCYDGYKMFCKDRAPEELLGKVSWVGVRVTNDNSERTFANVFGQLEYGRSGLQYTSYPALKQGLQEVHDIAKERNLTVAIPYGIGCGLGGGEWLVASTIIGEIFSGSTVVCEIWKLT